MFVSVCSYRAIFTLPQAVGCGVGLVYITCTKGSQILEVGFKWNIFLLVVYILPLWNKHMVKLYRNSLYLSLMTICS